MGSLLDDVALAHADNLVSADDCAESVSDHDYCLLLLLEQSVEGLLDLMLTVSVECASSLVKEKDSWSTHKGSGNGNTLLLATRESHAPLTDLGVEPLREQLLVVEEAAAGLLQGNLQTLIYITLLKARLIKAIQDVLSDRAGEETWLLLDDGKLLLVIPLSVNFLNVLLVEQHFTIDRIVEALDEGNDRRLSTARMSNKRDCLAIFYLDVNAFENGYVWFGRIVEGDVLDIDHSFLCVDHVGSHFLLVVVTHLPGWLRDQACDLIECTLHFGDLLQV